MNISIIACHPDDEVLGCGGTIAKFSARGACISLLHLTKGISSRNSSDDLNLQQQLLDATAHSSRILGIQSFHNLDLPDNQLDTVPFLNIVKRIELFLAEHNPDLIFTHFHGDLNIDHQLCNQAVLTACRPTPQSLVKAIFGFEVLSSTEWNPTHTFVPHVYHDISDFTHLKDNALHAYSSEMRDWPHSRSYASSNHLVRLRGSQVGLAAAEAFHCYRLIQS